MRRIAWSLAGLLFSVSCTAPAADEAALAPISAVLRSFDPGSTSVEGSFALLNQLVIAQPRLAADAAVLDVTHDDPDIRYAAVYVLALTAEDEGEIAALREALRDNSSHIRLIGAGALAGLGVRAAIPVLIDAVSSDEHIDFSPTGESDLAIETLRAVTEQDFGRDRFAWRSWWEDEGSSLRWNPSAERFTR